MNREDKFKEFAFKHKLIFVDDGEVGFGRPCVGFLAPGGSYVDFDPYHAETFEPIFPENEGVIFTPSGVKDAYHKHDCMAVLVRGENYDEALRQLELWVDHLEHIGVEVESFKTGAKGFQAMISGVIGYAFRVSKTVMQ